MRPSAPFSFVGAFKGLSLAAASTTRPCFSASTAIATHQNPTARNVRPFSTTAAMGNWLEPRLDRKRRKMKGRVRVATGGSTKGTTVAYGDFGLRMVDHHRRISAQQLALAETTIKTRLRGQTYRLYKRVNCNIGVFVSGNEVRMGKGKGSFDHWATRVAVNQIVFELKGKLHEQVARDAFRLAGGKLPGTWEFVNKGAPPVVGITKLTDGITLEELQRPRRKVIGEKVTPAAPPPPSASGSAKPSEGHP